jgi:putative peptidoglycan lipid II flippase
MSLLRSSAIVGAFTLLSRFFGFARDVIIANVMGAGMLTDAFFVAFKLPNFLRRLFAEGAFNAAFLPIFAGMLKTDGNDRATQFASHIMTSLVVILCIITALAIFFMPYVIVLLAPGYANNPEMLALTSDLTRITFPYIIFISVVCLLGGILNSHNRFAAAAFTPVLMNVSLIAALLFLPRFTETTAHAISIGVCISGVVQMVWLIIVNIKAGTMPRFTRPSYNKDARLMMRSFLPVALGAGVAQVNQLVDVIIASYYDNAVSYLYYADRLYELPLGVIGIAIATALLPMLSKYIRAEEHDRTHAAIDQALRFTALIGIPATIGLIVLADPIVRTIYQHGAFSDADAVAVIPALIAYSLGLPAFLIIKIFANCFFAARDTKTPVKIAIICLITNLVFNLILVQFISHVGLALATTISGWVNASLLGITLYKRDIFRPSRELLITLSKVTACGVMMGAACYGAYMLISDWFTASLYLQVLGMIILLAVGAVVYIGTLTGSKTLTMQEFKGWLHKE